MILISRTVLLNTKTMSHLIRKITVGKDYKNDAMHYSVGQEVYGGHTICDILEKIKLLFLGKTLIRTWRYL